MPAVSDQSASNTDLAGRVQLVEAVATMTVDAIVDNRLYVLPHEEGRTLIRCWFDRIDATFDAQAGTG